MQVHKDDFINASRDNPFVYNHTFPRASGQSDAYNFQKQVYDICIQKLEKHIQTTNGFVKHQMFMGRPGSGKTLVCTLIFLKAVAKGLNCAITCLSGERAQQLGGEHVHKIFKFIVNKIQNPDVMASQSLKSLHRDVTRFTELERLDVLFIDEIGQLNFETLNAMEMVIQSIRDNNLPKGGVFTIMTGDPKQLRPPDGSLIWLSPKLLTNFDFYYFMHYVRASPGLLRLLLEKLDQNDINPTEVTILAKEIVTSCAIKATWEEADNDLTKRVFSTRAAEKEAVAKHFQKIEADQTISKVIFTASDEDSSTGSSIWLPASEQNIKFIDSHSITPKKFYCTKELFWGLQPTLETYKQDRDSYV